MTRWPSTTSRGSRASLPRIWSSSPPRLLALWEQTPAPMYVEVFSRGNLLKDCKFLKIPISKTLCKLQYSNRPCPSPNRHSSLPSMLVRTFSMFAPPKRWMSSSLGKRKLTNKHKHNIFCVLFCLFHFLFLCCLTFFLENNFSFFFYSFSPQHIVSLS